MSGGAAPAEQADGVVGARPSLEDEWRQLARTTATRLRSLVLRVAPSGTDVDDIVAEALARTFLAFERVPVAGRPAFATRVALNLALGAGRKAVISRRHQLPAGPGEVAFDDAVVSRDELRQALASLPRRQREVVLLRYVADLSIDEVACVVGIAAGTVRTHADRGSAALRAALSQLREGG